MAKETVMLPQTLQAEQMLLGSILHDPLALLAARPLVPANCSHAAHALILTALRQLAEDGLPTDLATLTTRLERTGQLQRAGGSAYLAELARAAPTGMTVQDAAELVQRILTGRSAGNNLAPGDSPERAGTEAQPDARASGDTGITARRGPVPPPSLPASSLVGNQPRAVVPEEARARFNAQVPTLQHIETLLRQEFAPTLWVVPDLLPEGLTLLAAKPKLGKSWLALGLALAVAGGGRALGEVLVEPGAVLYLALEDSPKRLRLRTRQLLGEQAAPAALEVATQWPRLDEGGLDLLKLWLQTHPDARLVILDTLAKIRGTKSLGSYSEDYASLETVQALAHRAGVGILVIHHTGKESRQDPLDEVNATQGLAGVADNILVLRRQRGKLEATLLGDGRELNGVELWLRFDPATGAWSLAEPPEEQATTPERAEVLRVLKASGEPMTPAQVAKALGKTPNAIRKLLLKMALDGDVFAAEYGKYLSAPHSQAF